MRVGLDGNGYPNVALPGCIGVVCQVQVVRCVLALIAVAFQCLAIGLILETCAAAMFSALATIGASIWQPSPVRRRCSRASRSATVACVPASGSHIPFGTCGASSGYPVIQASPDDCSMVWRSRFDRAMGRTVQRRHAQDDDVIAKCLQGLVIKTPMLHDPRGEVLDDDVAFCDQLARQFLPSSALMSM